jgi:hypothetical protein
MATNHTAFRVEAEEEIDFDQLQLGIERELFLRTHVRHKLSRSTMIRLLMQLNKYGRPPRDAEEEQHLAAARKAIDDMTGP